jgi:hypothetical protein
MTNTRSIMMAAVAIVFGLGGGRRLASRASGE